MLVVDVWPVARNHPSHTEVSVDAELGTDSQGVLLAMGGIAGGVTLYIDKGHLVYEYNALTLKRTILRSTMPVTPGRHRFDLEMSVASPKPGASAEVALRIDGANAGSATVPYTLPLTFTATETFDVGVDLGSPVSLDYFDRAPFRFTGTIRGVDVAYKP